jgi:hypothetical protein
LASYRKHDSLQSQPEKLAYGEKMLLIVAILLNADWLWGENGGCGAKT